jgi:hypothetical protein
VRGRFATRESRRRTLVRLWQASPPPTESSESFGALARVPPPLV